jgi:hypothetical protein
MMEGHLGLSVHGLESRSKTGFWNYLGNHVRFQKDYMERIMDLIYGASSVGLLTLFVRLKYAVDLC